MVAPAVIAIAVLAVAITGVVAAHATQPATVSQFCAAQSLPHGSGYGMSMPSPDVTISLYEDCLRIHGVQVVDRPTIADMQAQFATRAWPAVDYTRIKR